MTAIAIHLVVADTDSDAAWYERALGAQEIRRLTLPDGRALMVELRLGDTVLAVAAEMPEAKIRAPKDLGGTPAALHLAVPDVDAAFQRAVAAGAAVFEPVHDAVWGDRTGQFLDPSGHRWALDTHVRDVPDDEISRELARIVSGSS
ncbi:MULTISPECIES: VOC family protein [unclassified Pseudofrankia]|uniref:VOC family protein n=1 Tax=unclassified Pseudofrankia TaxID=2994372 RepID=UPI0008D9E4AA|nr:MULTISPECIES: VOC family protein [unclassified Pseudofrankia]MDT3441004.1 VOC family protein [Pseudofrankia sp. BMG5.37]OHV45475.1 glyoxalase [Pseudofrankia sp. BMG5.36]